MFVRVFLGFVITGCSNFVTAVQHTGNGRAAELGIELSRISGIKPQWLEL